MSLTYNYTTPALHIHTSHTGLDDRPTLTQLLSFPGSKGNINLSQRIGSDYFTFGVFLLDDNGARIEALETKNLKNPYRINCDIFTKWLQGSGAQPVTWRTLVTALREVKLSTLADEIEGELPAASMQSQFDLIWKVKYNYFSMQVALNHQKSGEERSKSNHGKQIKFIRSPLSLT